MNLLNLNGIVKKLNGIVKNFSNFIEKWLKPIFNFLIYLRVQLTIILVTWYVFTQVDQTIEVYRVIALDSKICEASLATISTSILTIFVWYTSRSLELKLDKTDEKNNKCQKYVRKWGPRFLGIIPITSLICGIHEALNRSQNEQSNAAVFLMIWMILNLIVGIFIFILFIYRTQLFDKFFRGKYDKYQEKRKILFDPNFEIAFANLAYIVFSAFSLPLIAATNSKHSWGVIAVFIFSPLLNLILYSWNLEREQEPDSQKTNSRRIITICFISSVVISFFLLFIPPTFLPNLVGEISVVSIAFTILLVFFSTIYNWGQKTKIPALTILIGLVIILSIFNYNDDHRFRQFAKSQNSSLLTLEESFQQWLASRPDRDKYLEKPYPVYIASAQGGGIFAAYHAATAFAKLTEYVPSFPQHVFAISSVSGGSLGASAYASLVKESHGESQKLSENIKKIFRQDLLSPLLTLGLFPDLIQGFIPFSINDWDRANGLEIAFENAWSNKDSENPFKLSFYKHWQPQGVAPALVLNTTVVESGKRLVISPFQILLPTQENIVLDEKNVDLRLSTAAGLSARFPIITPLGLYQRSDGSKLHLADGGYFDGSGIITALDIGQRLQKMKEYNKSFEIIYLAIVNQPKVDSDVSQPKVDSEKQLKFSGLNEILSPVQALFNARGASSLSAINLSKYTINDGIKDPLKYKFRTLMLQKEDVQKNINLPLGWKLCETSKNFIDEQTPEPSRCHVETLNSTLSGGDVKNNNSCVAKSIKDDLS